MTVRRELQATPAEVWKVLADGWLYPLWVVGASRMREVDDTWPQVGSSLHHSVGAWPALIDDSTSVVEVVPESLLRLRARAWPTGEAEVVIRVDAQQGGSVVSIEEDAVSGPGRFVPLPVRQAGLLWRNVETLRRLAFVAERRGK